MIERAKVRFYVKFLKLNLHDCILTNYKQYKGTNLCIFALINSLNKC